MAVFLLYLPLSTRSGDDGWFYTVFQYYYKADLTGFLAFRYETWSTRLLLEAVTLFLIDFPVVFRLSMPLWTVAIAFAVDRIAGGLSRKNQCMLCLALLLISPLPFSQAGYVCSTVNYWFTLACFLWAIEPVVQSLRGKPVALWRKVLALLLMVVACNMEYYCPPALVATLVLVGICIKKRKNPALPLLLAAIVLASALYSVNVPTSTAEAYALDETMFPGYETLSAMQKLQVGFVSTAGALSTYNGGFSILIPGLTLGAMLTLLGWEREGRKWRLVYFIPVVIPLVTGCVARFCPADSLWATLFWDADGGWQWNYPAAMVLALLYFGALFVSLWRLRRSLALWMVLALGCRTVMGFSRSVFASGLRTFTPLTLVMAVACGLLAELAQHRRLAWAILCCGAGATVLQFGIYLLTEAAVG